MSVSLITGHKAVNHITAANDAAFSAAIIGTGNYVISDTKDVTITVEPTTGTVTVGAFSALFSGRKVVSTGDTQTYTMPATGKYKRVSVGLTYTKNELNDGVEDCVLSCYVSADNNTYSGALHDDTDAPTNTTIGSATTLAYFELFDLVVTDTAVSYSDESYEISRTLPGVIQGISDNRMSIKLCDWDSDGASGKYYVENSGESIEAFLADKRFAIFVFFSNGGYSTSGQVICPWASATDLHYCLPAQLYENEETKTRVFNVTFQNGKLYLYKWGHDTSSSVDWSFVRLSKCMIYAWR